MLMMATKWVVVYVLFVLAQMVQGLKFDIDDNEESVRDPNWHKDLFPLDNTDYAGFFCGAVGLMIAAGGGIGGGGVLVPLFILIMGFHPYHAIPLSNITILGGSIANCILNLPKRHPQADRPLIDFDLVLVMEPLTIAGAVLGSIINKIAPEILVTLLLVITLGWTSKRTWAKGMAIYEKESGTHAGYSNSESYASIVPEDEDGEELSENTSLMTGEDADKESMSWATGTIQDSDFNPAECVKMRQAIAEEERSIPMSKLAVLIVTFSAVAVLNLLKGTKDGGSPLGVECGSGGYWFLALAEIPVTIAVALFVRNYLLKWYHIKAQVGYEYMEGDVKWNNRSTVLYPAVCALAGLCAGLFGIGGGIVKGPLMLEMGVLPAVSSATAAFMILFTAASASISFVVFGMLKQDYAVPLFFMGFVCTLVGQVVVDWLVKKYQSSAIIVFSIASIISLSTLLMGYEGFESAFSEESRHGHGICE